MLLTLVDELPPDDGERIDAIPDGVANDDLRAFVRDELTRDAAMCERFFATFGEPPTKSAVDYRAEIDRLFETHTDEYGVVREAIDFSRFTTLAECYREWGNYRQAAVIYRALAEGIDEHLSRVDAAYDHSMQVFRSAVDAYVECVSLAALGAAEKHAHAAFLSERVTAGTDYLREHSVAALQDFRNRKNGCDG